MDWRSDYDEAEGGPEPCDGPECCDCGETCEFDHRDVWDDDTGEKRNYYWCVECDELRDDEGDPLYDGPSDYDDRMTERRQMGLCRY